MRQDDETTGTQIQTLLALYCVYCLAAKRRRDIAVVPEKNFSGLNFQEYALCGLGMHSDT